MQSLVKDSVSGVSTSFPLLQDSRNTVNMVKAHVVFAAAIIACFLITASQESGIHIKLLHVQSKEKVSELSLFCIHW